MRAQILLFAAESPMMVFSQKHLSLQGPVIYAQLDHSGNKNASSFHKMEPVVYADIRKN